ncbi:hypothetical protein HKX48_008895 [Thoreauomyces humboldtii]|nr:hypothetical protein HKX48_008895 [Thoreauomyces humboldtii]
MLLRENKRSYVEVSDGSGSDDDYDESAQRAVSQPKPAKKARTQPAYLTTRTSANEALRNLITTTTHRKKRSWLWQHRHLFLPLLPEGKNFFTRLEAETGGNLPASVPYEVVAQPKLVKATMKDYQLDGLSFLVHQYRNGVNGILGDEMGLGKTLQTLSLFAHVREQGHMGPFLVVCPLSVLSSWMGEIQRWVPHLASMFMHGPIAERTRMKEQFRRGNYDILVTTYEVFVAEQSELKNTTWKYVVLDEGHKIKNEASNVSSSLKGVQSEFRLLLTGTPLQNNLHELWALLSWLLPEVFTPTTVQKFDDSFNLTKGKYDLTILEASRRLLERVMIRRMKANVDFAIPPKEEINLYVPISPMQRFWYKRLLTRLDTMTLNELLGSTAASAVKKEENDEEHGVEELSAMEHETDTKAVMEHAISSGGNDWKKLMNLVMQLRKCCNHPYMLPNSEPEPFISGEHLVEASSKMVLLDKLLPHLKAGGHRTLLFSGFTGMLDILEDYMILRGVRYCRLDGGTSRVRRNLDIRLFQQKDSEHQVFLISTRAGGLGINLTSADTVIFYDSDWNPQVDLQALARAHRIGQTKPVTVYRLVCQDTVEQQMLGRLQKKLFLAAKVTEDLQDPNAESEVHMSKGELMSMLRRGARAISRVFETADDFADADVEHMLQKSREFQLLVDGEDEVDDADDFKLEGMEQVKSRLFEGVTVNKGSIGDIANEWVALEKRQREERTVKVGAHIVLKNTMGNGQWEACSTISGKGAAPAERKRKRKAFDHEDVCHVCSEEMHPEEQLECRTCPRSYHPVCVGATMKQMRTFSGYVCPQHSCVTCGKSTTDAGGMLFRCHSCVHTYCETCCPWDSVKLLSDTLPEFLLKGYGKNAQAFYIRCGDCQAFYAEHPEELRELEAQAAEDWEEVAREDEANRANARRTHGLDSPESVDAVVVVEDVATKGKKKGTRKSTGGTSTASPGFNLSAPKKTVKLEKTPWPRDVCDDVLRIAKSRGITVDDVGTELSGFAGGDVVVKPRSGLDKALEGRVSAPAVLLRDVKVLEALREWVEHWDNASG